jgi:ABC-type glycerol-3-phosphate transport system substrate-binding protein
MSLFQGIIIGILIVGAIGGVALFALSRASSTAELAPLTIWGMIDPASMGAFLTTIAERKDPTIPVFNYVYVTPENFERDFLEALAIGQGPDLVLLPHEELLNQRNKLFVFPYDSLSVRTFRELFIEAGEVFFAPEGTIALPFSIDPLVMYWNRTAFSRAGIAQVPRYWDEVMTIEPKLVEKDTAGQIKKAALALGEFSNISYAKDILATLFMQSGTNIVGYNGNKLISLINERGPYTVPPVDTAVTFFTQFSNPIKAYYSWSKALPQSIELFAQGDLAMLFAKASDVNRIQQKNPNLNFDVTEFPITRDEANGALTFGSMYGVGVVARGTNVQGAINAVSALTSKESLVAWEALSQLPPVRRDMLASVPADPYKVVFYNAALRSKVWYDPHKKATESIFKNLIDSVVTGRAQLSVAAREADGALNNLLFSLDPNALQQ